MSETKWKAEKNYGELKWNRPDHQAAMQGQVQVPTTDLLVHIVEPPFSYQKPEDSGLQ